MRVKRTVLHLHVSMLSQTTHLPGMGGKGGLIVVLKFWTHDQPHGWRFRTVCARLRFHMFVLQMVNVSSPHTQVLTGPTWWWRFDSTACPVGGKIEFWDDQNPIVPPPIPGRRVVGLNIDRCISPQRLTADLPTSSIPLWWENASQEMLTTVAFDCTWTETTQHMFSKPVTILHNTKEVAYLEQQVQWFSFFSSH